MAFVFTILASVFLITSSGFVCVIQAQGVSLLVSPPLLGAPLSPAANVNLVSSL